MKKNETIEMMKYIKTNYEFFEITEEKVNVWYETLKAYTFNDVLNNLKKVIGSGQWKSAPPLDVITHGLKEQSSYLDWQKGVVKCPRCGKAFNIDNESYESVGLNEHRKRCNSIDYVIRETKKWFNKDLTRAELWNMDEDEFNYRYNKLVEHIMKNTKDENQRTFLSYEFNPPMQDDAKAEIERVFGL